MKVLSTALWAAIACGGLALSGTYAQIVKSSSRQQLDQRVSVSARNESIYEVVKALRSDYKVPLCFVEPDIHTTAQKKVSLDLHDVSLKAALDGIVSQAPFVKYKQVNGRLVVFPDERKYFLPMTVDLENLDRIDAVDAYIRKLADRYPSEFGNLVGPTMTGFPGAPRYTDKITIKGTATVLDQLVQLLGDNPKVIFTIMSWKGTPPIYGLGEVD